MHLIKVLLQAEDRNHTINTVNMKEIIETWEINNKINLYLLNAIANENLSAISSS